MLSAETPSPETSKQNHLNDSYMSHFKALHTLLTISDCYFSFSTFYIVGLIFMVFIAGKNLVDLLTMKL